MTIRSKIEARIKVFKAAIAIAPAFIDCEADVDFANSEVAFLEGLLEEEAADPVYKMIGSCGGDWQGIYKDGKLLFQCQTYDMDFDAAFDALGVGFTYEDVGGTFSDDELPETLAELEK